MELLKKRYPDIGFFLSFFPHEIVDLPTDSKPLEAWLRTQSLDEVEVLYLVGLIGFSLPEKIVKWLEERKERALIFIEEDLGAFAAFNDFQLLENPQIHLHYAQEDPIEELAQNFPSDRIAIFEGKNFDALGLQRRSAALSALYSDVLYSHKIVENVLANYNRLSYCFDARGSFKNVPAIICGAGPSLEKSFPALRQAGSKALIFAGGSAIPILSRNQIRPHFAIALDPNLEEYERLKQSTYFEGPFLFAPRVHRDVFSTMNGPFGYLKTDTGGLFENWLEEKMKMEGEPTGPDMGPEAFSVTTLAVSYAFALGCNPIILAGVDLAYTSGKRYASGVEAEKGPASDPRALEKPVLRRDIYGNEVETLLKWVMESDCISNFAKSHPEIRFLNASEGGLGFEGIQNLTLNEALQGMKIGDLDGLIHQWIQASPLKIEAAKLPELIQELESSLERCESLCDTILREIEKGRESGQLILSKSDLIEEEAYQCLLRGIAAALDHLLIRYFPSIDPEEGKWERENAKFNELKLQIGKFRKILQSQKLHEYRLHAYSVSSLRENRD